MLGNALTAFREIFDSHLSQLIPEYPKSLYAPMRYIAALPSKKLRPFLLHTFVKGYIKNNRNDLPEKYWDLAAAIELLHNFTLIHDDIMDEDDFRQGRKTVHNKWDMNTAILGGDGLLALAFDVMSRGEMENFVHITREFSRSVLIVCEGQALDKEFEVLSTVDEQGYLDMIYKKTGSLIEASSIIGGYAGDAPATEFEHIRQFGRNLGIAFQLRDDYLDIFAEQDELGKDIGSDLRMRKKTIIMIKLMQHGKTLKKIDTLISDQNLRIDEIRSVLEDSGIADETNELVKSYTDQAKKKLDSLSINEDSRSILWELADYLEQRSH